MRFPVARYFIPRQQLLVHHPRDEGQDTRPIHSSSTPADSRLIAPKKNRSQRPPGEATPGMDNSPPFLQFQFFDHTGGGSGRLFGNCSAFKPVSAGAVG